MKMVKSDFLLANCNLMLLLRAFQLNLQIFAHMNEFQKQVHKTRNKCKNQKQVQKQETSAKNKKQTDFRVNLRFKLKIL